MENLSQQLTISAELLGLSEIKIDDVIINKRNEMIIRVSSIKNGTECHRCGGPTDPHGQGRQLRLRHLPIFGKKNIYRNHTTTRDMSTV